MIIEIKEWKEDPIDYYVSLDYKKTVKIFKVGNSIFIPTNLLKRGWENDEVCRPN